MKQTKLSGHLGAIVTVFIWGTTFIATKILLDAFRPVQIMMVRFVIGFISLCLISPKILRLKSRREEVWYLLAGASGITLYYYLENTALTYTFAANVGILIATVPFFTGLLAYPLLRDKSALCFRFFAGFAIAFTGIVLISLNGSRFHMNALGDFLTILAALCWSFYSLILRKINSFGYGNIQNTKRIFFWGVLLTVPFCFASGISPDLHLILAPKHLALFLYLGVGACAVCYVLWNRSIEILGPVQTNIYIYLNPVTTLIASVLILKEPFTPMSLLGTALILCGLILSQSHA